MTKFLSEGEKPAGKCETECDGEFFFVFFMFKFVVFHCPNSVTVPLFSSALNSLILHEVVLNLKVCSLMCLQHVPWEERVVKWHFYYTLHAKRIRGGSDLFCFFVKTDLKII